MEGSKGISRLKHNVGWSVGQSVSQSVNDLLVGRSVRRAIQKTLYTVSVDGNAPKQSTLGRRDVDWLTDSENTA